VPAHNEGIFVKACLAWILEASINPHLAQESVVVFVVPDRCIDPTQIIAEAMGARTLKVSARNVGFSRAVGARAALASKGENLWAL